MICFDLHCQFGHGFEGWFGSSDDYASQLSRGLIACPVCGDGQIAKSLCAPNIGRKSNQSAISKPAETSESASAPIAAAPAIPENSAPIAHSNAPILPESITAPMIAKLAEMQQAVLEKSEWVGRGFADEARSIYYGESDDRMIHGEASPSEAASLAEEGIQIAPLPFPILPPQAKN